MTYRLSCSWSSSFKRKVTHHISTFCLTGRCTTGKGSSWSILTFYLSDTINFLQPLDQGIIHCMYCSYWKELVLPCKWGNKKDVYVPGIRKSTVLEDNCKQNPTCCYKKLFKEGCIEFELKSQIKFHFRAGKAVPQLPASHLWSPILDQVIWDLWWVFSEHFQIPSKFSFYQLIHIH
jgi:hypothetical protein